MPVLFNSFSQDFVLNSKIKLSENDRNQQKANERLKVKFLSTFEILVLSLYKTEDAATYIGIVTGTLKRLTLSTEEEDVLVNLFRFHYLFDDKFEGGEQAAGFNSQSLVSQWSILPYQNLHNLFLFKHALELLTIMLSIEVEQHDIWQCEKSKVDPSN